MGDFPIPDEVADALRGGREAYLRHQYDEAEVADQEALRLSVEANNAAGIARATRLIGLCAYRAGDVGRSAEWLERARAAAREATCELEELLTCNHLGATYRKLGRLDEAHDVFCWALEHAPPRTQLEARARLTGNYGAFLDHLGEQQAAGEHYARYEELLGLIDDPVRLANARGLVSRAHRLRGDYPTALVKAEDERRLGAEASHTVREGRGWLHIAQAQACIGDLASAEQAFEHAEGLLAHGGDIRTPIEIATARGRFYLENGRLHEAHEQVSCAQSRLAALSSEEHEHRAHVAQLAAEVATEAGLHGEALWHLSKALEYQLIRFEPIADPRLHRLTQNRRRELAVLAARLVREAGVVDRAPDELKHVQQLLLRLATSKLEEPAPDREAVLDWRGRVRERALQRWDCLLPGVFRGLPEESRSDLILADVVSQGPVGDLARSVFLIFATIERELRQRVIEPLCPTDRPTRASRKSGSKLRRIYVDDRPPGLGEMVEAILEGPQGFSNDDPRVQLERRLPAEHGLGALSLLQRELSGVDGATVASPLKHRNAIAHGTPLELRRTDADAVRRLLTLGPGAVLGMVTGVRVG